MHRLPQGCGREATENTELAAALTTLGFQVQTNKKIRESTAEEQTTFVISDEPIIGGLRLMASAIIHQYKSGALEKVMPNHQLLDAIAGLRNRKALLSWMKTGASQCLAIHPDRNCPRTRYVPGKTSVFARGEMIRTNDLAIAAALGRIGVPVVKLEGTKEQTIFVLPPIGFPLHRARAQDARQILADHASGKLQREQPLHPFRYAHQAVKNYQILLDHLHTEMPLVFFEDEGESGRAALIRLDAKRTAYDLAKKFFDRPLSPHEK